MSRLPIASRVATDMKSASWIREMFEKGRALKALHGDRNVFDFSLGNPNAAPPAAFFEAAEAVIRERAPRMHRYMANAGFDETRAAIAAFLSKEYRLEFDAAGVIVTCGAAGGLNVTLRALCDPGDEVILIAPFFPEYSFYIEQAGAKPVVAQSGEDFQPDLRALEAVITEKTRAVIVNSPNNPTGAVYAPQSCAALGELLARYDRPDKPVYLLCDDPYKRIVFDCDWCPTAAAHYARTIIVSSYSKDLSIPGERAGYIGVNTRIPNRGQLLAAMTMLNRTLGFVNAPAFIQRVLARCADARCDLSIYRANRDRLCAALREFGYDLIVPGGALYIFPRTPIDDAEFVHVLLEQRILAVPGRGFGRAGHMRISFAVEPETIEGGLPGFKTAIHQVRNRR